MAALFTDLSTPHRRAVVRRSQPRIDRNESPITRKSTVIVMFKCLLHVGHEPGSRVLQGLLPPPMMLCLNP